ncbi:hypothetical protein B0A75_08530 [Flavobacterium oncorhynchi]|uniref:Lipoprotein n=1 Tax=Flavobacterium oncorhynchi TaxID=728056 RepID=A0A226I3J6_9FLAO|nr:hypothetical protein [Flavobacterium oncorhynchi]OXB00352.1 hypothetical protein B0A75_08530 [Flavobacterium oncorhynchi]
MKFISAFLLLILLTSCTITETIIINPDGTGNIEVYSLRDENSVMQLRKNSPSSEKFIDTIFVFQDYITKYQETFVRFSKSDQALFQEHSNVKMHVKMDPIQMENFNIVSCDFKKIEEVPNVYESLSLASCLKENYTIVKPFYKIKYSFDGVIFRRNLVITDQEKFDERMKEVEDKKNVFSNYKLKQSYVLNYYFPRKIKSISNEKAVLSADRKSLSLEFQLSDCLKNSELTNLEVILE